MAVVFVGLVGLVAAVIVRSSGSSGLCPALAAHVTGLQPFTWDNGYTGEGPAWGAVLTDGVEHADAPSRSAIASAVRADEDGYQRLRDALPADERDAFERLHAAATAPDGPASSADDHDLRGALVAARHLSVTECNQA